MEWLEVLSGLILGIVIGAGITYRIIHPDIQYLKGFVDFHRKDLSRLKKVSKRFLKKFDIEVKD